jgi:hypothetical protein
MSKHVTGMCRVGKFLKLWKEKDSADFQICGNFDENVTHVWQCQPESSPALWKDKLEGLHNGWTKYTHLLVYLKQSL